MAARATAARCATPKAPRAASYTTPRGTCASGVVCLGGYGTYWVPSLALDDLCGMLWDMIRYQNFDEKSPYNREAAAWTQGQSSFSLPIDNRPIRNKLVNATPPVACSLKEPAAGVQTQFASPLPVMASRAAPADREVPYGSDIVEAELAVASASTQPDILFIE